MNNNIAAYVKLTAANPSLQNANLAFGISGLVLTIGIAVGLGVSIIDVGLGIILAMGFGFIVGAVLPVLAALVGKIDWYLGSFEKIAPLLGPAITILGVGFFVGLPAALLIVITPMLITMPAFAAFRAWAIRHYG